MHKHAGWRLVSGAEHSASRLLVGRGRARTTPAPRKSKTGMPARCRACWQREILVTEPMSSRVFRSSPFCMAILSVLSGCSALTLEESAPCSSPRRLSRSGSVGPDRLARVRGRGVPGADAQDDYRRHANACGRADAGSARTRGAETRNEAGGGNQNPRGIFRRTKTALHCGAVHVCVRQVERHKHRDHQAGSTGGATR